MQNISTAHLRTPFATSLLRRSTRTAARAFTLVEILIVLAIAAMIIGVAVNNLVGAVGRARSTTAKMFVNSSLDPALMQYSMDMGDFPSTAEGLQALVTAPAANADRWHGPYLKGNASLTDPWSEPYQYRYPGTHNTSGYDVWSKGPDKQDGTADDIGNWAATANSSSGIPGMPTQ